MKENSKGILKGLVVIGCIIVLSIVYGTVNHERNLVFILVFLAFFVSLVGFISIIIESIDKTSLKIQLSEKKSIFSYMLYVNFIALYISELFLGKISYLSLMYIVLALIFFYMSLENYFFKDKKDERIYDLVYTIIIALTLAIVKTGIDYFSSFTDINIEHICINIVITLIAIALFVYGVKIVDEKQLGTNPHENNMDRE